MPSDDLKNYATSETDFYTLLGVTFETSQKDIDRAWRRTALKYHPDKVGNDPSAKEKFHLAQIGYDLLSDPASKALYDNARTAKLQRKRQNEAFEGRRRQMKDDLEARERGVKRPREDEEGDEEKLEREIRRLAEDGKRRRKEREDALRADIQREAEGGASVAQTPGSHTTNGTGNRPSMSGVSEIDRTVKVRWPVEGAGGSVTADQIKNLFSKFGVIESADLLNPKMLRLGEKKKKQLAVICMIQYKSVVGAHAAVEDFPKQCGLEWKTFDSVFWASNKEPEFINAGPASAAATDSPPSTPIPNGRSNYSFASPGIGSQSSIPTMSPHITGDGLRKVPSFASFSPGPNSPSLEERTMIRLKNAEKKRLAVEIERQDREDDTAEVEEAASG